MNYSTVTNAYPNACPPQQPAGALSAYKEPEPISPILQARGDLETAVNTLHIGLDALERRLDAVLVPLGPDTANGVAIPPQPPTSPTRMFLQDQTARIAYAISRLERLTGRLEV